MKVEHRGHGGDIYSLSVLKWRERERERVKERKNGGSIDF